MARLNIDTGTAGNRATGDTLRTAMEKINTNFIDLYGTHADTGLITTSLTNGDIRIQPNGTGIIEVDDVQINNSTISTTTTNADLVLTANGTGDVVLGNIRIGLTTGPGGGITSDDSTAIVFKESISVNGVIQANAGMTISGDITQTQLSGGADLIPATLNTGNIVAWGVTISGNNISTNDSNADLEIDANGTGAVSILTQRVFMKNLPTSDPSVLGQLFTSGADLKVSQG